MQPLDTERLSTQKSCALIIFEKGLLLFLNWTSLSFSCCLAKGLDKSEYFRLRRISILAVFLFLFFREYFVFMPYSDNNDILVPCNPVGRTGLYGRGHLGRWGPNHAAGKFLKMFFFLLC